VDEIVGIVGAYPHTEALLAAPFRLSSGEQVRLRPFGSVAGGAGAVFARQARHLRGFDFAISELPIVNYLSSREHGARHTALPVFLTRRFVHSLLVVDRDVVRGPRDLEGQRVGLLYFGHSDSTWLRAILAGRHGVDLSRVEWITETEEQVAGADLPDNVVHIPRTSLSEMLVHGEVVATMTGPVPAGTSAARPSIGPLWPEPGAADRDWYTASGIFPILHTLVVKDELLAAIPNLAQDLYAACQGAREDAVTAARAAGEPTPEARQRALSSGFPLGRFDTERPFLPEDPSPYGLEENRQALETLVGMARDLHIIETAPAVEGLFADVG
jgi:4,5-dihydroxyphthalate decarboxylase